MRCGARLMRTGQFGVVHTSGKYATAIRLFQSLRVPAHLAKYTHSVIAIDGERIIEAWPGGARIAYADEYDAANIVWSTFDHTARQAAAIRDFARAQLGKQYAWEDVPLIALALATGEHTPTWVDRKLSSDDRWICSELVDAAFQSAGIPLFAGIQPSAVYPAMLAQLIL
jgi:Uncharacterized distant relative of cell wall-associated hydrolases